MHRTTIYLTPDQLARMEKRRAKTGMSISEFIRRAIDSALKKAEAKP